MANPGLHLSVNCIFCGKVFTQYRSNQMYCSNKCGVSHWRAKNKKKQDSATCKVCGKQFFPKNARHVNCSSECAKKAEAEKKKKNNSGLGRGWSKGIKLVDRKTCQRCGNLFYAPPALIRRGGGKFCSNDCRVANLAEHPEMYPQTRTRRGRGGMRDDLGGMYFRSSWEANWARYLNLLLKNELILSWQYEVDTFNFYDVKTGSRFYTPDFKITNVDESIEYEEVKGYMDKRSKEKLERMSEYYPDVKIKLILEKEYKEVCNAIGHVVSGWELRR